MAMFFPAGTVRHRIHPLLPFIHRVQHAALLAGVLEAHVAKLDGALEPAELAAAAEILGGLVQHFEHAGAGRESLLQRPEAVTRLIGAVVSSSAVRNPMNVPTVMHGR